MLNISPKVSIWCTTYNHEKYIAQAIEGFLMQKVNFDIEIIIHDDASTDKTAQVIKEYEAKYPQLFKCIYQSENQLSKDRSYLIRTCFRIARGDYIAICEGDDYWTDPYKLQKQVDFFETNKDFAMAFCNVLVKNENGDIPGYSAYQNIRMPDNYFIQTFPVPNEIIDIYDIAKGNFIHTPGVVFRNILVKVSLPRYLKMVPIGDWPLYMFISQYGKIRYFEETMAVYRVHNNGQFSSMSEIRKEYLGLAQYPPMINEGIFDDKIIQLWTKHTVRKLADLIKINPNEINEQEIIHLFDIFNSTRPSLLKKTIDLLTEELTENKETILSIQSSRTYRLSRFFLSPIRIIRKILPFKSKFTIKSRSFYCFPGGMTF